jgi:hypothetical protein
MVLEGPDCPFRSIMSMLMGRDKLEGNVVLLKGMFHNRGDFVVE